jgi:hypothetical protein
MNASWKRTLSALVQFPIRYAKFFPGTAHFAVVRILGLSTILARHTAHASGFGWGQLKRKSGHEANGKRREKKFLQHRITPYLHLPTASAFVKGTPSAAPL